MSLIVDIEKKLHGFLLKVNLKADREILALLGASGSGKSMTLKCIAGIEKPDRGHIELDGTVLFDSEKKVNLTPQDRRVGYLFQQYALFPNMTVRKHIACGMRHRKYNRGSAEKADNEKRIEGILHTMHLEGLEDKYPSQISGGEQQRTALARILVNDPEVLLLDEPFSALDTHLRFRLERELRETLRQFGKPVLLVSHDRDEVYRMADRIAVIKEGSIEAAGTKQEVFADPRTVDGARLTGCKNISRIRKEKDNSFFAEDWGISLLADRQIGERQYAGIRMHDLRILPPGMTGTEEKNQVVCMVDEEIENPFSYTIMIRPREAGPACTPIGMELDKKTWQAVKKDEITVCFPPEKILLLK